MLRDPHSEDRLTTGQAVPSWLNGLSTLGWSDDERAYAALLDALARQRIQADASTLEMGATSRRSMADVKAEEQAMARDRLEQARRHLTAFREALEDARSRGGAALEDEVPFDSADPVADARADVLIQYLVRTGYAEVRTEERAPGRYVYHLRVDWSGLRRLAAEQGHGLPW